MTDRPIIFSAPMIRALLEGRKTQTRRILKPQPPGDGIYADLVQATRALRWMRGDRLWVRENWRVGAWDENSGCIAVDYCDGPRQDWLEIPDDDGGEKFNRLWISTCDELEAKGIQPGNDGQYEWEPSNSPCRWRPSIHMPRWASRLTLIVEGVKVERLQDISEENAITEGAEPFYPSPNWDSPHVEGFARLWENINGANSWHANPWVAAISFRVVKANIDEIEKEVP